MKTDSEEYGNWILTPTHAEHVSLAEPGWKVLQSDG